MAWSRFDAGAATRGEAEPAVVGDGDAVIDPNAGVGSGLGSGVGARVGVATRA